MNSDETSSPRARILDEGLGDLCIDEPEEPGGGPALDVRCTTAADLDRLRTTASRAARLLGLPADGVGVMLVSADEIAAMKERAFGVRAATDVLSFPIDDLDDPAPGPVMAGDVVLCPEVADRQALALGRSLDDELDALLVHGMLHLRGRDHASSADEVAMAMEQRAILAATGRRGR